MAYQSYLSYMSPLRFMGVACLTVTLGCSEKESALSGDVESKPIAKDLHTKNTDQETQSIAKISYDFQLLSNSALSLCNGVFSADLGSDYELDFENSDVTCGEVKVNIAKILRPINLGQIMSEASFSDVSKGKDFIKLNHDGSLLRLEKIGDHISFSPPRPLVFGPLIHDQEQLKGYAQSWDTTVTVDDGSFKGSGKGSYQAKVISVSQPYEVETFSSRLTNTIHWQITASGFETLPDQYGLLLPHFELWFNSNPMMIPRVKVIVQTKRLFAEYASEIEEKAGSDLEANFGDLVGDITIDIKLREFSLIGLEDAD